MPVRGGTGGGNTATGAAFEERSDLLTILRSAPNLQVRGDYVYQGATRVGAFYKKQRLYSGFLAPRGIYWRDRLSKQLFPDEAVFAERSKLLTIVEKKYQQCAGSVDEKLQTCDFKSRQYQRLFKGTGIRVQYTYLLNDWFKHPSYEDVLRYIRSVGCEYFFNDIPISHFRF